MDAVGELLLHHLDVDVIARLLEGVVIGLFGAVVGGNRHAVGAGDELGLFGAKVFQDVQDQVLALAVGGSGVAQTVRDGGPTVPADRIGAFRKGGDVPFPRQIGEVVALVHQLPVALQVHGPHFGEEGDAGLGLGKIGLVRAPRFLLKVYVKVHGLLGAGLVEAGPGFILGEDIASGLVDEGPVSQLFVVIGHIAPLAGGVIDLLGGVGEVVPGPGFVGVGHLGGVEHLLVVDQDDVVLVLGDAVHPAVAPLGVVDGDLRVMVLIEVGVHIGVQVGDIRQHPKVGVVQDLVGVHPKDVRHGVAFGGGLQLGPILAPVGDLHLDLYIGVYVGCVSVADCLHTVPLGYIPDLEFQMGLAI